MKSRSQLRLFVSGAAIAVAFHAPSAFAQSSAPGGAQPAAPSRASGDAPRSVDEIIVTAQKRSELLRDVPLSVTAATGDQLAKQGITNTAGLERAVPGFTFVQSAYAAPIYTIRGIGTYDEAIAISPAVSVYMDQVPLPFSRMTEGAVLDLQRVEALKGPQGTLFGQNSTGGAVNYVAAKPTDAFAAGVELTYGRFNQIDGTAYVSGPISDQLRVRLSARRESRGSHLRRDFPECETRLNGYHSIVTAGDTEVVHEAWG